LTTEKQKSIVDFSIINIDSVVVSSFWVRWSAVFCGALPARPRRCARALPGGVEMLVEMVDSQAKGVIHNARAASWWLPWR
jgi:F-type H+-transporting ATPase subunit a